jgi:ribokinase
VAGGTLRVAAVGHVEWVQFGRVRHIPRAGEVAHARDDFEEPAGGGAVAAVQLARLAGASLLITALGRDDVARRALRRLRELGVRVCAAERDAPTRRATTLTDEQRERTIITFGERLQPQRADEQLPWGDELARMDAVYFTAGDAAALRAARAARVLVASPRARDALGHGVRLDALILSDDDEIERRAAEGVEHEADAVLRTRGERGGTFQTRAGEQGSWDVSPPEQGDRLAAASDADSYGCGDSFAAGVAFALASGMTLRDAISLGARCGAVCATGRGPYEHQLTAPFA